MNIFRKRAIDWSDNAEALCQLQQEVAAQSGRTNRSNHEHAAYHAHWCRQLSFSLSKRLQTTRVFPWFGYVSPLL